ncbi:CBS domain-containing protein [Gluconacetobacter tumulisoli]|uniref:CBS domain-containing protein n=1 Tax=Gluconacetobacter tumulisoli TaxID=1286189 RepID=A0A7W4K5C5_9PROT|nr:CBS domain-containing protein [Gluconacetobacter tumulisoli]MBB2200522.1 CBS domain-containing protein [Gluconacetobacter tumulisoli]
MQVKDIMTSPAIAIDPFETIEKAASLMLSHRMSGMPVVTSQGQLVGVLTEGDLLRRSELGTEGMRSWLGTLLQSPGRAAADYVRTHGRKVGDIMTAEPIAIAATASVEDAVDKMLHHHIKRLPVLEGERLVGILSRADILRALLQALAPQESSADDESIRAAILEEYRNEPRWAGPSFVNVQVHNGVVELSGAVFDSRLRTAARVAAENVKGVESVIDHLVFVEPMTGVTMPM